MTCADFENLLTEYAEGKLDRIVSGEIEQHRRKCPQCHLLFQEVSRLVDDLHGLPEYEPPERLMSAILKRTSGVYKRPSFWQAIVVPTFRPFLTQRFAAATAIMFVFLFMTVSLIGPGLSGVTADDFTPRAIYKHADNFTHSVYHRLRAFNQWTKDMRAELQLWRTDWAGRIDYQIITALFRNYENTQDKQQIKRENAPSKTGEPETPKGQKKEGKPDKKSSLPLSAIDGVKWYSASIGISHGPDDAPAEISCVPSLTNHVEFPAVFRTNRNENVRQPL